MCGVWGNMSTICYWEKGVNGLIYINNALYCTYFLPDRLAAKPGRGYFLRVPPEPPTKRAMVFIDGQNLFHAALKAFGYTYPNSDPLRLAQTLCTQHHWECAEVRFYTGVPDSADNETWHQFWAAKKLAMMRSGVRVYSRPLRYRNKIVTLPDGTTHSFLVGEEKGIDVRIAVDVINLAHKRQFDVALVLSQDQDLSEVADEIRIIAREQHRWIKIASAFPYSPTVKHARGINGTEWIRIDRTTFDACIDPKDYRAQ